MLAEKEAERRSAGENVGNPPAQIWEERWWQEQAAILDWQPIDTYEKSDPEADGPAAVMLREGARIEFGAWGGYCWHGINPEEDFPLRGFKPSEWAKVPEETRILLLTP